MSFYYSKEFVIWDAKYLGFHTKVLMNTTSERLRVLWNDAIASYRSRGIFTIGEQILIYCKKKKAPPCCVCIWLRGDATLLPGADSDSLEPSWADHASPSGGISQKILHPLERRV